MILNYWDDDNKDDDDDKHLVTALEAGDGNVAVDHDLDSGRPAPGGQE